ncbi:hypothetical protein LPJ68_004766 [Coemansia sp. RSA 1086]|nr:hypothetical protein LPJ68_004766 [Coemansia sp. RSA 1086]
MRQNHNGTAAEPTSLKLEAWWDSIFHFFSRHRATTALVAWAGVSIFDTADIRMPAEWLVFTLFSFSVFAQVFGMSILLFVALTTAMAVLNVLMYYLFPFSVTSLLSTLVVCMLLVRGVHGLDTKGWAVTALMSLSRLSTPWCEILPDYLQAPVAAYCASFGILWIVYHSSSRLERLIDPLCLLLGVIPPIAPRLSLVEVGNSSVIVSWSTDLSLLAAAEPEASRNSSSSLAERGLPGQMTRSSSHLAVAGTLDQHLSSLPANRTATANVNSSAGDLKIGKLINIDRKQLPEAQVAFYEVEVNSHIVGQRGSSEKTVRIQGLLPAATYQIRVWAISESRGRTPSAPIFVKIASSEDALASYSSSQQFDLASVIDEIAASKQAVADMEDSISALKSQTDLECGKLQKEAAELRTKRKEDEGAKAAQRDQIRKLEATKRDLEKEKAGILSRIAEAAARKQLVTDRRQNRAKQTEEYRRMARAVREKMEQERRDYEQEQSELTKTIEDLKQEAKKTDAQLQRLSEEQAHAARQLQHERAGLVAREKDNSELEAKIKQAQQQRRRVKASQKEAAAMTAKLQAEVDSLKLQLEKRLHLKGNSAFLPRETVARPPPIYPKGHEMKERPYDLSSVDSGRAGQSNRQSLPSSFSLYDSQPNVDNSRKFMTFNSLDLGDLLESLDREVPRLNSELSRQRREFNSSSNALFSNSTPSLPTSRASATVSSSGKFGLRSDVPGFSRDIQRQGYPAYWRSPPANSLSTTTAEASALSILKDTDLAYPVPQQVPYSGPKAQGSNFGAALPQPPAEAYSGLHRVRHPLSGIFGRSLDTADPLTNRTHLRYNSTSTNSWTSNDLSLGTGIADGCESGRNSTETIFNDYSPFLMRTASPAEQPQALFSGDVLGVHSLPGSTAPPSSSHRPSVDPIGAPVRGRRRGPSLGALSARSSNSKLADTSILTRQSSVSCRTSMDNQTVTSPTTDSS